MRIQSLELLSGAGAAKGIAVIIDVFRAASVANYAFAAGADRIFPVDTLEEAYQLKADHPDYLLVGERQCLKPDGFDYGNSPSELRALDLTGRTLVHATTAGTRGLAAAATVADRVLFCSFPNVSATADALTQAAPALVSIVAMGKAGQTPAPEDALCGVFLANILEGVPNRFETIPAFLRETPSADIFFGKTAIVPPEDFALCLALDACNRVLEARRLETGRLCIRPTTPEGFGAAPV